MRKLLLVNFFLLLFFSANAQLSFEGTKDFGNLQDVTADPATPDRLFAITKQNHVLVSNDRGLTWNIFYSFPKSTAFLRTLKMLKGGKALSFVAFNAEPEDNGLYILDIETRDTIKHYTPLAPEFNSDVPSYDIADPQGDTVLIHSGYAIDLLYYVTEVFLTKDGGKNYKKIYSSTRNNDINILNVCFRPGNTKQIYLARNINYENGGGGLLISANEGNTWKWVLKDKGAFSAITFNPKNPDEFFIGSEGNAGTAPEALYHTFNNGATFEQPTFAWTEGGLNRIIKVVYDPGNSNTIWMLEENEILKSTDGGLHWSSTSYGDGSQIYYYGTSIIINPKNGNDILVFSDAWPHHSLDGGKTFTQLKMPFFHASYLAFGNYSGKKQLYYSALGGYLTRDITTRQEKAYDIVGPLMVGIEPMKMFADTTVPGRVFLFRAGDGFLSSSVLYYSDDYGVTRTPLPVDQFATDLQCLQRDPNNPGRYWLSYSYYFSSSTLSTLDISNPQDPQSTPISFMGNGVLTSIFVPEGNNGQTVYTTVGTELYLSADGGATWNKKGKGLTGLAEGTDLIWDMKASPFNENEMAMATTRGIFQSDNGGEDWQLTNSPPYNRKITFSNVTEGQLIAQSLTNRWDDPRIIFTTNKGKKWSSVSSAQLGYPSCPLSTDIDFYPDHADVYFATPDIGVVKYELKHLLSPQLLFLNSFTGRLQNKNALLEWKTQNEEELLHYELERSTNNKDFSPVNTQQAHNSNGMFQYNYEDQEFQSLAARYGNIYYRLKLVSEDNSFAYSDTVKLTARDMYIYPVPATDVIHLHVQGVTEPAKYRVLLTDITGRQYTIQQYNIPTGQTEISMPISRLTSGVYFILVETRPGEVKKFKFIKL